MWSEQEIELTQKYSEEIRQIYNESSVVPHLARLRREDNPQAPGFLQIGKKFIIPRDFFEVGHIIIVRPFAEFVKLSEFQYAIDVLREIPDEPISSENPPDGEMINDAIAATPELVEPDYIIIPIAFFVDLHTMSRASRYPIIQYKNGQAYYNYAGRNLHVLWSNKYISLNEIIIGNSRDSLWLFKSDNGGNRLTVEFFFEEPETNPILLVQTIFRFHPPPAGRICVIKFPESLCEVR